MPKISKVRIVNFNYNDGNRLIADELYDFSNQKNDDALNVLINLANGGGKSVLVQLMMQPVIPKAKVAGRKVESFFNKLSDHCYVVIEWLKDDSKEKLLTGISIAAREVMLTDDETSGGMGIKYYTFYANYVSDASECSLVNLPLSRMENGRFIPAEYDEIKKFAKKSKSDLTCYTSDDNPRWQQKLSQYGLVQDEWRMMEKLNSEEGGLGKFFGDFKTSDQLIDRLLIPTIETKVRSSGDNENSSLSTMLISYARQYAGQKSKLHDKEVYEKFQHELNELKPMAEELWTLDDKRQQSESMLFGLSVAMQKKIRQLQNDQAEVKGRLAQIDKDAHHIRWEQASSNYYIRNNAYEKAEEDLQYARQSEEELSDRLDDVKHNISVLECASYYQNLRKCSNNIDALQKLIYQKENGSEASNEINVLGYSAACAIKEELKHIEPVLDDCSANEVQLDKQINEQEAEVKKLKNSSAELQAAYNQLYGKLEGAVEETDKEVNRLNLGIIRKFTNLYATEEFDELETKQIALRDDKCSDLEKSNTRISEIDSRIEQIPQDNAKIFKRVSELENQQNSVHDKLQEYEKQEDEVRRICDEYNLNFAQRFTTQIYDYLTSTQSQNEAQYADILRQLSLSEEGIEAAERGYLHIPKGVIDYLNSTGIVYTTCEKYLLDLVEANKLSENDCLTILKNYPAAAYGILMEEKNIEKFFAYGREKWLPAMVPIFTYRQMDKILRNEKTFSGAIAFYSVDYFADKAHYIANLTAQANQLKQKKESIEYRKKRLQEQLIKISNFTYRETWREEQELELERLEKELQKCNSESDKLAQEKIALQNEKASLTANIKALQEVIGNIENTLKTIDSIRNRIALEMDLESKANDKKSELDKVNSQLSHQDKVLEELLNRRDEVQKELFRLKELRNNLTSVLPEVDGKTADEQIQGNWKDLYDRYVLCVKNANTEIKNLQERLHDQTSLASQYQSEIQKRALPETAYKDAVYSEEELTKLNNTQKEIESKYDKAKQEVENALLNKGSKEGCLESVKAQLQQFGGPLEKSQIGADFENRLNELDIQREKYNIQEKQCEEQERNLDKEYNKLENYLSDSTQPAQIPDVTLEEDYVNQRIKNVEQHKLCKKQTNDAELHITAKLNLMLADFSDSLNEVKNAVSSMQAQLENKVRGDRYYTLTIFIDEYIKNTDLAISKISLDLKEFDNFRGDIVHHCTLQGKQIFEGLQQMASSSRVTVYDGRPKQRMIQFDFPEHVDPVVAEASIADEVDKGTKELVEKLSDDTFTEPELKKYADKIVGSKSLLRKYIGRDSIGVSAYKIDRNPENSGYRKWKDTQINNSGAEKFVIYFAVILSLMNYTRGGAGAIQEKERHSVLILDNPFGATSSKHILVPMFAIAKHFRVQMICLSDINKTDVINCFDIVIKAVVKKRPMSNHELLTHEGNELIEHGFYRSEQMSIM